MFGNGSLTLREFAMKEPLPLARIQEAVLERLKADGADADAINEWKQLVAMRIEGPDSDEADEW
jgi:hypothetical protein